MRLIRLILINMKRQLKNPVILLITLIFPIVIILIINYGGLNSELKSIGIIDKSNSNYSTEIIKKLNEEYSMSILNGEVEDNFNLLRENKLRAIYVIDYNFKYLLDNGKYPKIKCYKNEATSELIMAEDIITSYICKVVLEKVSGRSITKPTVEVIINDKVESKDNYKITISIICYFMMIGSSVIAGEVIKLRNQKVLKRTISTSNTDINILGSLFISSFIIQGTLSSLVFIILTFLLKIPSAKIPQGVLIIFLGSLIITSIILAITRWIKNVILATMSTVTFGMLDFGVGILGSGVDKFENVPEIITRISIISPFTWLFKIMDTGKVIIPILIIFLMSIMFFTAGSFRLREFVKE